MDNKIEQIKDKNIQYIDLSSSIDGQLSAYGAVWRDYSTKYPTIEVHSMPRSLISRLGTELLNRGYLPLSVSVTADKQRELIGAVVWSLSE